MKKHFYSLFAAAAMMLAVTSCSQEEDFGQQSGGDLTTFSVVLDGATLSRTAGDGTTVDQLYYEVYQGDKIIYDDVKTIPAGKTSVDLQLMKGETYQVTFWAQNSNSIYDATNLQAITATYDNSTSANNEAYDAFFNSFSIKANGGEQTVYLYRPFAQLNVGTSKADWETAKNLLTVAGKSVAPVKESQVTVKGLANTFNAVTGKAEGNETVTFNKADISAEEFTATTENKTFINLAMNYLLVPGEEAPKGLNGTPASVNSNVKTNVDVEVTFWQENMTDRLFNLLVANAPIQRNYRTNIIGDLLADASKFNVEVVPGWGGEEVTESDIYVVDDTYHILTAKGLQYFAQLVNGEKTLSKAAGGMSFANNTVVLENDIDLAGINWTPIGKDPVEEKDQENPNFKGIFDGNNKTISNLTVDVENGAAGLFGWVQNMVAIKNVKLVNAKVSSNRYAGALVGWVQENGSQRGTLLIENCSVDGAEIKVSPDNLSGKWDNGDKAGGLIGYAASDIDIKNCKVANSTITGYRDLGGIIGMANSQAQYGYVTISDCSVANSTIKYNPENGYETAMPTTFGDIFGRGSTDGTNNTSEGVTVSFVSDNNLFASVLKVPAKNLVITLSEAVTYDISAWNNNPLGTEATKTITIDGKSSYGITFNQKNSDWNNIVTNGATLVLKNMNVTNTGHNDGPWNRHNLNFGCNVEMENVSSDKAIALKAGGILKDVTINDKNTSDTYAIWIQPNGQTVTLEGCTINMLDCTDGRGIKIDEQYVDTPKKVTLKVSGTTFKTEEKSAVLVKSTAGADIIWGEGNDISKVKADNYNAVWVDEANADYYDLVTVNGASKLQEGTDFVIVDNNTTNLSTVIANLTSETGATIVLPEGNYTLPSNLGQKEFIIEGQGDNTTFNFTTATNVNGASITFKNLKLQGKNENVMSGFGIQSTTGHIAYEGCTFDGAVTNEYYGSVSYKDCTFTGTGYITTYAVKSASFEGCTFDKADSRAVLVYSHGDNPCVVTLDGCTFKAAEKASTWQGDWTAAVEVDTTNIPTEGTTVTITNCTADGNYSGIVRDKSTVGKANAVITVDGKKQE